MGPDADRRSRLIIIIFCGRRGSRVLSFYLYISELGIHTAHGAFFCIHKKLWLIWTYFSMIHEVVHGGLYIFVFIFTGFMAIARFIFMGSWVFYEFHVRIHGTIRRPQKFIFMNFVEYAMNYSQISEYIHSSHPRGPWWKENKIEFFWLAVLFCSYLKNGFVDVMYYSYPAVYNDGRKKQFAF